MMHCLSAVLVVAVWLWQASADTFSDQLEELFQSVKLPEERQQLIPKVLAHLEWTLSKRWPECRIQPYGSYVYGLATVYSDVDTSLMLPEQPPSSYNDVLAQVQSFLERFPDQFSNFKSITWVLAPVLSFKHVPTDFSIDVSINAYQEFKMSALIKYLTEIDERVFNLAFIVKYWAKMNNLTGAHVLANHGMTVLVIFYLQQKKILPTIESLQKDADPYILNGWNYNFEELDFEVQNNESLRVLTGEFFEFYAMFNFEEYIVSPYVGYPIERTVFEDLDSVPDEFVLYKDNVRNGITEPLSVTKPVLLQDIFMHNQSVMSFQSPENNSSFIRLFRFAAWKYYLDPNNFLNDILSEDVALFIMK